MLNKRWRFVLNGLVLSFFLSQSQSAGQIVFTTPEQVKKTNGVGLFGFEIKAGADPYFRADALRKEGKIKEALEAINEALRIDQNRGEAYGLRSGIEGSLQQFPDGVADADIALKLSKTAHHKAMAAYNKGYNLAGLNRKQEALDAFNLSLRFDPTYSMAHFGRGRLFYLLRLWKESKTELDAMIAVNPQHGPSWAYRAEDQLMLGSIADGVASAEKAVEFAPSDPRSFRARGIARQFTKRFDEMLADATRSLELDSTRPLAHLLRGKAFGFLGRLDEALAEYALEPDRKAVEPYLNGVHREMYGTRLYNCGDFSTEFELYGAPRIDTFEDCQKRISEGLIESAVPASVTPVRKSVPNLPARRREAK